MGPIYDHLKGYLSLFFDDKRYTTCVMLLWLSCTIFIVTFTSTEDNTFLHVGPSNSTYVMGVHVNTWPRYYSVCLFAVISSLVHDFIDIAIDPWMINVIQDEKTTMLPYPKHVCLFICQSFSFYNHVMALFGISLLLSQLDFFIIRTTVDLFVGLYGTMKFMEKKTVDASYQPFGALGS